MGKQVREKRVPSNLCKKHGCKRRASFGVLDGARTHCSEHREKCSVDLNRPICGGDGCTDYGSWRLSRQSRVLFCKDHKTEAMSRKGKKTCAHEECNLEPSFNMPGLPGMYCGTHKLSAHVNVTASKCDVPTCETQRSYTSIEGEKFCAKHARTRGHMVWIVRAAKRTKIHPAKRRHTAPTSSSEKEKAVPHKSKSKGENMS